MGEKAGEHGNPWKEASRKRQNRHAEQQWIRGLGQTGETGGQEKVVRLGWEAGMGVPGNNRKGESQKQG